MNRHSIPALALALLITTVLTGCTTPPIKKADKDFERAWLAFVTDQTDKAHGYFADAADDYDEALNQDPPSRVAHYPSSRVKAGMSFYFAGLYEQCIDSMLASRKTGERIWEADFFTGLSHARLGDRENAARHLSLFLDGMPPVRTLFSAVENSMAALANDGNIDEHVDMLEKTMQKQVSDDIRRTTSPNTIMPQTERCNGTFWWRKNKKPCSAARDTGQ